MSPSRPIRKGDLILVVWNDILTIENDDPDKASLHAWETPGYFHGTKKSKGMEAIVIRRSAALEHVAEADSQAGWTCIPIENIREIRRLTRAKPMRDSWEFA